jgi:Zn finger protein HypA/HybF involved in hydrogenase expression
MTRLWQALLHAVEEEDTPLSCEECFVMLDYLSDMLASGYPRQQVLAIADKYLRRCPNCHEELVQEVKELIPVSTGSPTSKKAPTAVSGVEVARET